MSKRKNNKKQNIWQIIASIVILTCIIVSGYMSQNEGKTNENNNTESIKEATEKLTKVFYEMSEQLYKNANPNGGVDPNAAGADTNGANTDNGGNDGTVYDADYKVEDDDNK